jgi:sugar phosphate isomerase/epimerase
MTLAPWSLGVFTSIDAGLGVKLEVAKELGVPSIQLHTPHAEGRTTEAAQRFLSKLKDYGIELTCVFGGFDGESYADIPTVERTIGLVPRETRAARLVEMKEISDFTRLLGCSVIGLHVGVVPHDRSSKDYQEVIEITRQLCDHAANNGQAVHLETGQETAEALLHYIEDAKRKNLFINFDPANMILYGTGEPIPALKWLDITFAACIARTEPGAISLASLGGVKCHLEKGMSICELIFQPSRRSAIPVL